MTSGLRGVLCATSTLYSTRMSHVGRPVFGPGSGTYSTVRVASSSSIGSQDLPSRITYSIIELGFAGTNAD